MTTHGAAPALYYEVHGDTGPYLLLVHGLLASRAQWLPNIDALIAVCRPVVVELYGHGRSPAPDDRQWYRPAAYGEEFERLRHHLGVERWLVCGQSLGAALTLRYVLDHPAHVAAHVFTNSLSALAEDGWTEMVRPFVAAQARLLEEHGRAAFEMFPMHPGRSRRLPEAVKAALVADCALHDPHGVALTCLHTIPDSAVRGRVISNQVPTLLVCGEREERFVPYRRFAEERMPGLEVVGLDAGHAVNAEAGAGFNDAVIEFFHRQGVITAG